MKLPDETQVNMSAIDNSTTYAANNFTEQPSTIKKHKSRKDKKTDDNVVEMGGTITDDNSKMPATKKRRRNNKDKNKQDDVTEGGKEQDVERKEKKKRGVRARKPRPSVKTSPTSRGPPWWRLATAAVSTASV